MPINIQDSKMIQKYSTVTGVVPTAGPTSDFTDGTWTATDIYEGEIMANVSDSKVWMRMNAGIREFLITRNNSATGDLYYVGSGTWQRLPIGTSGQVLTVSSGGVPTWAASTGGSSGSVPTTRTITINGNTQDLSADRTWTIDGGVSYGVASGTNTYTVTISGVSSYTEGDVYAIKFTNANDADSTININGLGAKTLVKQLNIQVTGGDIEAGQQFILIYDGTNFQMIGVAPNQLFAYVTNDESVAITKGQPVYAYGSAGNRMSVKLASNTADATSAQTVGVVFSSSIGANQRGFIITQGVISGVNTSAYTAGDQLYLGATSGTLTATKPVAPNHLVYIGIVERANAGNGQIYIKPQNGYELNELHDVLITTPANNNLLVYETGTNNLWKNKSLGTVLGGSTSQYVRGDGSLQTFPTLTSGTVTSVSATVPSPTSPALSVNVTNPTTTPAIAITANGTTSQYVRGDGSLQTFPTLTSGTVTSVAVASGTTGSDVNISGSPITTSGTITINIPTASSTNRGALSSTDWTTFNQKSGLFILRFAPSSINPVDATIYYTGDSEQTLSWGTTAAARRFYFAGSCELIAASLIINVTGTVGSAETSTLAIRKNNTTDFTIQTGITMNTANNYIQATGLSGASFVSGDYFELKWTTPTWATNPTNVRFNIFLYFR